MKNKILTKTTATLFIVFALAFTVAAQNRYGGSFAKGVELFYQKDYSGAINAFEKAEVENPGNHAAYLWHGMAVAANDNADNAGTIWLKMPWDTNSVMIQRFLQGLAYWREGRTNPAKYWFEETKNYKETQGYKLSQVALKALLNNEEVPPIEVWATLASLPGAKKTGDFAGEDEDSKPAPQNDQATTDNSKSVSSGTKPSGGLWRATISNGYKGQTLSFRVSANGKMISDITFQGYLQCRGSRIENTELAPLENVAVSGGTFDSTQLNGGAQVRFDFNGVFNSATTASGSYRVMSSTDCDTYKLNWTASRVGN